LSSRALLAIGKIVKARGIRGDVVVRPMTDRPARFKKLNRVFVGSTDATACEADVLQVAVEQRGIRLRLANATDRNSAEDLIGSLVFVEEGEAIRLPRGTFFVHDVIGLNVLDDSGNAVGIVKDVIKYPANEIYVVDRNGKELLLPAVKEFIKKIDLQAKTMRVKLIEGMIEEPEAAEDE
jgi:16S rRNA processing protein RimM